MAARTQRDRRRWSTLIRLVIFVTVTGALTVFIAAQIARINLSGGYGLEATFDDASGLTPGDQVKIAGAPVGRVDEVKAVDGRARVKFTVNDSVKVPADSEAAIRWRDAIGRRVVYLVPGTDQAMMRPGTHITRTRSVVDVGELLTQLAPLTRTLKPEQVNQLLGSLSQALDGNGENVDRLIANVDQLSSTIAARRQTLGQMINDYSAITSVVARRDKQIAQSIDNLVDLSDAFVNNRRLVDDSILQLAAMTRTADQALGRNGEQLGRITDRLGIITAGVRRNTDTINAAMRLATPKLQHIFEAADNGEYLYVAAPCVGFGPLPCSYPTKLPKPGGEWSSSGAHPVNTPKALRRLMVGGN